MHQWSRALVVPKAHSWQPVADPRAAWTYVHQESHQLCSNLRDTFSSTNWHVRHCRVDNKTWIIISLSLNALGHFCSSWGNELLSENEYQILDANTSSRTRASPVQRAGRFHLLLGFRWLNLKGSSFHHELCLWTNPGKLPKERPQILKYQTSRKGKEQSLELNSVCN